MQRSAPLQLPERAEFKKPKNAFSETKGVHGACSLHVAMRVQGWNLPTQPPRPATDHCSLLNRPQTRRETEVATSVSDSVCRRCWKFHRRRSGLATKRQRYRRGGHADADKHRTPTEPIQHLKPGSDWHIVRVSIRHRPHIGRTRGLHPGN